MPGFPVLHSLPEFAQIHVHWVSDAIQPSHSLSCPSPLAFNLSKHQDLFQWVGSLHYVAKVLELQLQHQSFQWIFRVEWFDILAEQGTLKSLPQHHSSKAPVLWSLALPFSIFALIHEWHKMTMPQQQSYGFSSSHVWMWELDHKEGWVPENECFQIVVLEKTLEGPLDCKEIKPVNPKRNQPWIFIGRTDAEAEALMLWPPDVKSWLIGKDPDAGKNWSQEEKKWQRMRWLHNITDSWTWVWANSRGQWRTGKPGVLHGVLGSQSQTQLSNWAITTRWC